MTSQKSQKSNRKIEGHKSPILSILKFLGLLVILYLIALLGGAVIITILSPLDTGQINNPTEKAKAMLTDLYNKRSTPKETVEVTFDTLTPVISKEAVTVNTSLSPDQVCFSLGDYASASGEWDASATKLRHVGPTGRNVRLGIECSLGIDALEADIDADFDGATLETDCACTNEDPCCAIVLRRVR